MRVRTLAVIAVVLISGCASFHRIAIPRWERYQQGELAGFLRAPAEQIVDSAGNVKEWVRKPAQTVRLARGRIEFQSEPVARVTDTMETNPTSQTANVHVDSTLGGGPTFVFELRGPSPDRQTRTVATRSRAFDFGPVPDGTYTLKATVLLDGGFWRAVVATITVADAADAAARITIVL